MAVLPKSSTFEALVASAAASASAVTSTSVPPSAPSLAPSSTSTQNGAYNQSSATKTKMRFVKATETEDPRNPLPFHLKLVNQLEALRLSDMNEVHFSVVSLPISNEIPNEIADLICSYYSSKQQVTPSGRALLQPYVDATLNDPTATRNCKKDVNEVIPYDTDGLCIDYTHTYEAVNNALHKYYTCRPCDREFILAAKKITITPNEMTFWFDMMHGEFGVNVPDDQQKMLMCRISVKSNDIFAIKGWEYVLWLIEMHPSIQTVNPFLKYQVLIDYEVKLQTHE